ncbi:MAG: hypothetical protein M1834_001989 [Cirrosporium novae-zelandiae]|nr:MAG: hypothetical protein M1834_001989 [Cirrosporium novae-zelandiae]
MSAQTSQKTITTPNTVPTPASTSFGPTSAPMYNSGSGSMDGDAMMDIDDQKSKNYGHVENHNQGGVNMDIDHPRELQNQISASQGLNQFGSSAAGTSMGENGGDEGSMRGVKRSSDWLRENTESHYLVCNKDDDLAHRTTPPYYTHDMLDTFGLGYLAAQFVRTDEKGQKLNKLRRSYKGYIMSFGLAGRNKATNSIRSEEDFGPLHERLSWPDEEWQNQRVSGKDVETGWTMDKSMEAKLAQAMQMEPGPVPIRNPDRERADEDSKDSTKWLNWEHILGTEKSKPVRSTIDGNLKKPISTTAPNTRQPSQMNGVAAGNITPNANENPRLRRRGRKRRYDEGSFEGYGEGYMDDDGETSADDGSRRGSGSKKKRKKDFEPPSQSGMGQRTGSYGIGMMSVGAYGR